MKALRNVWRPDPGMARGDCEADAELAAEMAAQAAHAARRWAYESGIAKDDAAEAVRAAMRARAAAQRVRLAKDDDEARLETAAAWAATESALEADQRVVAAIAEALRVA